MTIRQIADMLNVSPSTVSVVLNNRPGVRSELRERIKDVLIENGYTIKEPKTTAGTILFVYYKSTNYLAARKDDTLTVTLNAIEQVCREERYTFSLTNATYQNIDELFSKNNLAGIDGIILLGTEYYHEPRESFYKIPVPLVVLDGFFPEYPINTVNIDNSYGMHQVISYLLENGHRDIGYLKSAVEFGCLRDRKDCIRTSMERLGLQLNPDYLIEVSQESEKIQAEMTHFLEYTDTLPTAFIADNDIIGVSAIQALQRKGLRIPEDISIVGFDDSNICTIFSPQLTTVKSDFKRMAELATRRLIQMISLEEPGIIKSTVGTTFIPRQTVSRRS